MHIPSSQLPCLGIPSSSLLDLAAEGSVPLGFKEVRIKFHWAIGLLLRQFPYDCGACQMSPGSFILVFGQVQENLCHPLPVPFGDLCWGQL